MDVKAYPRAESAIRGGVASRQGDQRDGLAGFRTANADGSPLAIHTHRVEIGRQAGRAFENDRPIAAVVLHDNEARLRHSDCCVRFP
jgi:hypothetical protein